MKTIIAAGLVIIENNKILLANDRKDNFYKIPGGKPKEGETLEDCALRELKEETGLQGEIQEKLPTMALTKNPQTNEEMQISLHQYKGKLSKSPKNYAPFSHNNHDLCWFNIDAIKGKKHEVAPNVYFILDKI